MDYVQLTEDGGVKKKDLRYYAHGLTLTLVPQEEVSGALFSPNNVIGEK